MTTAPSLEASPLTVPPEDGGPPRRAAAKWRRIGADDLSVLRLYLFSRVGLWIVVYCTGWMFPADDGAKKPIPLLSSWERWDWGHYRYIAEYGYFAGPENTDAANPDNREAFFPGFPMLLRAVHTVIPDWTVAGLVISLVSGAVAVVALARLARHHFPDSDSDSDTGRRAVLFLLLSPTAIFLAAGYTEALFLAFALPAWLAAKEGRWPLASVLAMCATTTRVSGLFLVAAMLVEFLVAGGGRRRLRSLPWLVLPGLPVLGYFSYLYAQTGDLMAWSHAQERGWNRAFHSPWEAWGTTWEVAFDHVRSTGLALTFQAELLAMVIGVLLLGLLLWRRRWPEATYMGLTLWALGTSYWYLSIARSALLWWPLWIALAAWSLRHRWVKDAYICLAAPLMTVFAVAFASGRWVG